MTRMLAAIVASLIVIFTGCSSTGSTEKTQTASTVVNQVDASKVEQLTITRLHDAFLDSTSNSSDEGKVIDVSGEVIAFEMTEDNRFSVTLRDENKDALCLFSDDIANQIGSDKAIHRGANITVRGQLGKAGLFSSTPFVLDGCAIVND